MNNFKTMFRNLILLVAIICFGSSTTDAQSWTENITNIYPVSSTKSVVIGAGTPSFSSAYKLAVTAGKYQGGIYGRATGKYRAIYGYNPDSDGWAGYFYGRLRAGGISNPSIELYTGSRKFQFAIASCNSCYNGFAKTGDGVIRVLGGGDMIFSIPGTNGNRKIAFHSEGDKIMTIQEVGTSGKVGVGTTNFPTSIGGANITNYKLFVKGGILTEEVRVRTGWADYVFEEDYSLKSLAQVESYIKENGHLPNVPSAATVEEEGIEIGDITRVQQEKIEELFLHLIELDKKFEKMNQENKQLKAENEALKNRVKALED